MERYELVEGKSSKFWEASVDGATLTVRFGRIGTEGQSKDKEFASAEAAAKEKDKLVKEKTGKGYALVGEGPAPAPKPKRVDPEPAQAAPDASAAASPVETPPIAASRPAPAPAGASAAALDRLVAEKALPTRSRPGAPLDRQGAWNGYRELIAAMLPVAQKDADAREAATRIEARLGETGPDSVEAELARQWFNDILLVGIATLPNDWRVKCPPQAALLACLTHFAEWLVATAGALTTAEAANRLRPSDQQKRESYRVSSWSSALDLALRAALVKAPEADYDAAAAFLAGVVAEDADWRVRAYFAFILADDRPTRHELQPLATVEAAEAAGEDVGSLLYMLPLVADARPSSVAKWRSKKTYYLYLVYCEIGVEEVAATAIATARHHGEAALPALDWLLHYANDAERTALARMILASGEDGALGLLLPLLHEKWIRAALDEETAADPANAFRQCLAALAAGRVEPAIRARVLDGIEKHGPDTVRSWAEGDAKAANQLEKLLAARNVATAAKEAWPAVLRDPPWRKKAKKATADIVIETAPIATPFAFAPRGPIERPQYSWFVSRGKPVASMSELAAVVAEIEGQPRQTWWDLPQPAQATPKPGDDPEGTLRWLETRLNEIWRVRPYAVSWAGWDALYAGLEKQPEPLALMLWENPGPALACQHYWREAFGLMLDRYGARAVPGLVKLAEAGPIEMLPLAIDVDTPEIAPVAARALLKLKKARVPAADWLKRHRRTAITRLVPDAVGKPGPARDAAEHALRWFAAQAEDGRREVEAIAATYAKTEPQVVEAIAQVLDRDPFDRFPSKIAKIPGWFTPSAVTPPELKSGGALPGEAIVALVEMLSFSTPDAVYAGVAQVKDETTPSSAAAFAWDMFSAWLAEGAPSKDGWAMRALGWLGDDDSARQLTRLIRKWPGESAHARAVTGLDVLVDIGSDVALMNLNGVAEKLKFKGLQEKAREKIAALAEARELTPEELSDRLAPDLDLDERGGVDLVFGERQFRAGFDEFLKPWVKDLTGARLKDLPKPNKSDDAELAAAAVARWSALKKDARAVSSLQIARLENMLSTSRRVKPEVFWTFFASHPLIRHLAQRLVWGAYPDDDPRTAPSTTFRVADDLTLTDAEDETIDLDVSAAAEGVIGLVHPLHLPDGGFEAWGALFGDYEIAQPFPQLGRETYALTEAEKSASEITRFDKIEVEAKRLRGMGARGWPLGSPQDGGCIWWIERPVRFLDGTEATVTLDFGDGLFTGASELESRLQTLGKLSLGGPYRQTNAPQARTFGELDPVTASELLRGPSLLAETRAA